jgi:acyl carrier protein
MTEALGQICAQNLQLDAPPPPDLSLREAGLDSLLSITVINDIENVFGTRLAARALLRGPSVAELADMVLEALPDLGVARRRGPNRRSGPARRRASPASG